MQIWAFYDILSDMKLSESELKYSFDRDGFPVLRPNSIFTPAKKLAQTLNDHLVIRPQLSGLTSHDILPGAKTLKSFDAKTAIDTIRQSVNPEETAGRLMFLGTYFFLAAGIVFENSRVDPKKYEQIINGLLQSSANIILAATAYHKESNNPGSVKRLLDDLSGDKIDARKRYKLPEQPGREYYWDKTVAYDVLSLFLNKTRTINNIQFVQKVWQSFLKIAKNDSPSLFMGLHQILESRSLELTDTQKRVLTMEYREIKNNVPSINFEAHANERRRGNYVHRRRHDHGEAIRQEEREYFDARFEAENSVR